MDSESYNDFQLLKADLSNYFEGDRYFWLRFLLFDHLSVGEIANSHFSGDVLFDRLEERGLILPTDVNLLLEVTKLTECKEAEDIVLEWMENNRVQKGTNKLTPYRKRLFKTVKCVSQDTLMKIIHYYDLNKYKFSNLWDVILKLEINGYLSDDPNKIRRFSKVLTQKARNILLDNDDEGTSQSQQDQPSEDFSEDDFKQLISNFAQWFDDYRLLNRLQVLLIGIVSSDSALRRATSTHDLLVLLTENKVLSKTDLTVLYDTIKVTEQFGFQSTVTKKLPPFKCIKDREVVLFSPHTINIFNLGKSLRNSDVKTLDARYNFPLLQRYTDSWSLIFDFENRGLLNEDNIKSFEKLLQ